MRDTGHRVVIVFRKLPDEPMSCLVVETDSLPDRYHQNLMEALESVTAQETMEFYEYAQRQFFYDGSSMLNTLHTKGFMRKVPTERVIMRPRIDLEINLSDLNTGIDQVRDGIDPATIQPGDGTVAKFNKDIIDDATLARNLRSQADMYESQAKELRKQAEAINPTREKKIKPAKKNETVT